MMKNLWFKTITVFVFCIQSFQVTSQQIDNDKAHRRYWYYRTRMINDFTKIGKNQGDCIVFAERNDGYGGVTKETQSKPGPDQIDIMNMYLMTLALEYKILSRNGQSTAETIKEIYHILYTINRLDMEAEAIWDNTPRVEIYPTQLNSANLNGFILREDMPRSYIRENLLHFNYSLKEQNNILLLGNVSQRQQYGGFTGTSLNGILHTDSIIGSKFSEFHNGGNGILQADDLFWPQDKYFSCLNALLYIDKYIPPGVNYSENGSLQAFQDGLVNIKSEARAIAGRIYNYCKGTNNDWQLYLQNSQGKLGTIHTGYVMNTYSWPTSRMACMVQNDFPWNILNSGCGGYNDITSLTIGKTSYDQLATNVVQANNPIHLNTDIPVFQAWCSAGSNLPAFINTIGSVGTGAPTPSYIHTFYNSTVNHIEWADLNRKVLHQSGLLLYQPSVYADALNVAPCQGPYNYGGCTHGGFEWSSQDRLEHQDARDAGCSKTGVVFKGHYPGVDYMLLHNLYYEHLNQLKDGNGGNTSSVTGGATLGGVVQQVFNWLTGVISNVNSGSNNGSNTGGGVAYDYAYNYMDNLDVTEWPKREITGFGGFGSGPIFTTRGTTQNPAKVAVFQNLTSYAHINFKTSATAPSNTIPSDVTYRAGKEISLLPGFEVQAGGNFHAYIQRYICFDNNDALNMRHIQDTSVLANPYFMDYEMDDINPVPLHYIPSPKSDADNNPVITETVDDYSNIPLQLNPEYYQINEFSIQPNPSSGIFKVYTQTQDEDEHFELRIYDMRGQLISTYQNIGTEFEVNLSSYSKGIYMVQVLSSLGKTGTKRIDIVD